MYPQIGLSRSLGSDQRQSQIVTGPRWALFQRFAGVLTGAGLDRFVEEVRYVQQGGA
jgi:hypothetical protein